MEVEVINQRFAHRNLAKVKAVLANVVKRTAFHIERFFNGGKNSTAAVNYAKDGAGKYYASSFVGYFLLISIHV
jgi:hypothetical protein